MNTVTLKNGAVAPEPAVMTTMISLRLIADTDPIALYELLELCRDRSHQLWGRTEGTLTKVGLLPLHDVTRDIVLSAVSDEDLDISLGSPVAEATS